MQTLFVTKILAEIFFLNLQNHGEDFLIVLQSHPL